MNAGKAAGIQWCVTYFGAQHASGKALVEWFGNLSAEAASYDGSNPADEIEGINAAIECLAQQGRLLPNTSRRLCHLESMIDAGRSDQHQADPETGTDTADGLQPMGEALPRLRDKEVQ